MDKITDSIVKLIRSGKEFQKAGRLKQAEDLYQKILQQDPDQPEVLFLLGTLRLQTRNYQAALEYFNLASNIRPENAEYFYHQGLAAMALEDIELATQSYQAALDLEPNNALFYNDFGYAIERSGDYEAAIESYQKAIECQPDFVNAYFNLALAHTAKGNLEAAILCYEKALKYNPTDAEIHVNLGGVLKTRGEPVKALTQYEKAIQLRPKLPGAYFNIGLIKQEEGDFKNAASAFEKAISLYPYYGQAQYQLAQISRFHEYDKDIRTMETLLLKPDIPIEDKMYLSFALGKALEDIGDYGKAFSHLSDGNRIKRASFAYSIDIDRNLFEAVKQICNEPFFSKTKEFGNQEHAPIFIVGMPRSGTSLIEQILASHPRVFGAGELPYIKNLINEISSDRNVEFPVYLLTMSAGTFERTGAHYLHSARKNANNAEYITDKMPGNFRYIGFINAILPNAKVIHCVRSPMDNCFSIFKTAFAGTHGYAYDLVELGRYYNLYRDLMAHWDVVLPGFIHTINYEEMVADQEMQTRRLLEFCGLPWDDACLSFHATRRRVKTASLAQVRQPIYTNSVGLWKRYEDQLEPLRKELFKSRKA